ncbi:hypothetical protein JB92DRAFT_2935570 [Gautieria morchelliformis]|nr:hypothetical protein JB92DRAFT_2935570 [Gautieria morchelliformis]
MVISVSVFYPIILLSSGPLGVGPDTQLVPTTADTFMSAGGVISYDELTTRPNAYPTHAIKAAHLPSGSNEVGTAYRLQKEILVPYQTVQGPAHIVDEEATAAMYSLVCGIPVSTSWQSWRVSLKLTTLTTLADQPPTIT